MAGFVDSQPKSWLPAEVSAPSHTEPSSTDHATLSQHPRQGDCLHPADWEVSLPHTNPEPCLAELPSSAQSCANNFPLLGTILFITVDPATPSHTALGKLSSRSLMLAWGCRTLCVSGNKTMGPSLPHLEGCGIGVGQPPTMEACNVTSCHGGLQRGLIVWRLARWPSTTGACKVAGGLLPSSSSRC